MERNLEMEKAVAVKFCGLTRPEDVEAANSLKPEYIGFVFWPKSKRFVSREKALELKKALLPGIKAVGVFVDEDPEVVFGLLKDGVIDIAQLHGSEDEEYIAKLRDMVLGWRSVDPDASEKPIIKAIVIKGPDDIERARACSADYLLLDSGKGTGQTFNWELIRDAGFEKPFFLAGGLDPTNVGKAVEELHPFAVDVSSGIETDGRKDPDKMKEFVSKVRNGEIL